MVGVGITPTSITSHPEASSPQVTACCNIGPLDLVSRPTTTRPAPTYAPNACAKEHASDGVRNSPTTPRIPETPTLSRCSLMQSSGLAQSAFRIIDAADRLAAHKSPAQSARFG